MKVEFKGFKCELEFKQYYNNNNTAIVLMGIADDYIGEIVGYATTNTDHILPVNIVAIKDYSENTGMAKALVEHGVIYPTPVNTVETGFIEVSFYLLTDEAMKELINQRKEE